MRCIFMDPLSPATVSEAAVNEQWPPIPSGAEMDRNWGLKWMYVGASRPSAGREVLNEALAYALQANHSFTKEEFDSFRISSSEIFHDSFVKVSYAVGEETSARYFQPQLSRQYLGDLFGGQADVSDPGVKSEPRLTRKVQNKYGGDWAQMRDASRFSLVFSSARMLVNCLNGLQEGNPQAGWRCVRVENRFRNPTPLGWRDFTVMIRGI